MRTTERILGCGRLAHLSEWLLSSSSDNQQPAHEAREIVAISWEVTPFEVILS